MIFENKNRIILTLGNIEKIFGKDQNVYLGIEITKLHERSIRGSVSKIYEKLTKDSDLVIPELKGEICIVIAPYEV